MSEAATFKNENESEGNSVLEVAKEATGTQLAFGVWTRV